MYDSIVGSFLSNLEDDSFRHIPDEFTNTTTIQLRASYMARDVIGTKELNNITDSHDDAALRSIYWYIANKLVRIMLDTLGISSIDLIKLDLVKDMTIEDIMSMKDYSNELDTSFTKHTS